MTEKRGPRVRPQVTSRGPSLGARTLTREADGIVSRASASRDVSMRPEPWSILWMRVVCSRTNSKHYTLHASHFYLKPIGFWHTCRLMHVELVWKIQCFSVKGKQIRRLKKCFLKDVIHFKNLSGELNDNHAHRLRWVKQSKPDPRNWEDVGVFCARQPHTLLRAVSLSCSLSFLASGGGSEGRKSLS